MTAPTLGFGTSGPWCCAALVSGGACLASRREEMDRGQAERLMPLLEEVLEEAGRAWSDLGRIGVDVGPGNFTGTRIAVSAARGLALALGVPAVGVTILDALAHGLDGRVLACRDARRGQGYFRRFGHGDPEPFVADLDDLEPVPGLRCVGDIAPEVARRLGAECVPPAHGPGEAIALAAAGRPDAGAARPAPLYLRAPDAVPVRAAPAILP